MSAKKRPSTKTDRRAVMLAGVTIQLIDRARRIIKSRHALASSRANLILAAVMKFVEALVEECEHNTAFITWDESTGAAIDNCIECEAERLHECLDMAKDCDCAWKAWGIAHDE